METVYVIVLMMMNNDEYCGNENISSVHLIGGFDNEIEAYRELDALKMLHLGDTSRVYYVNRVVIGELVEEAYYAQA